MQVALPDRGKLLAESTISWWRDAGVDYLCAEEAVNWLEAAPQKPDDQPHRPKPSSPNATPAPAVSSRADWPAHFDKLMEAIGSDPAIPGNNYGRQIVMPIAVAGAELMVIGDFPEEAGANAVSLGDGAVGQLIKAMVRACGYDLAKVHIGALAHSRPASGALPPQDAALLADFARHQISAVKADTLLLLGSAVSEILLNSDFMTARANTPIFNHDGRKMAAVTTFHPRTLLARPILKAQAWQDLQAIVKKDHL
jgi:uracil-DNA glycosylase